MHTMPHIPPAHHETSKRDSPDEIKIKEKQNKTILDSNSNLAKSMTHHNQTKKLTTWFLKYREVSIRKVVPLIKFIATIFYLNFFELRKILFGSNQL
jgi:hypothetical protein